MEHDAYQEHRCALIEYLLMKVKVSDWHGVSDAANDLRELEAERRAWEAGHATQAD